MTFQEALKKARHVRARVSWNEVGGRGDPNEFLAVTKSAVRERVKRSGEPTHWRYDNEYGLGPWLWLGVLPDTLDDDLGANHEEKS